MKVVVGEGVIETFDQIDIPELIKDTSDNACMEGRADDAFYVCNLGDILRKHQLWNQRLPRVEPFYAIKCNPDKYVVKLLSSLNVGFDCASRAEISHVLNFGVPPEKIIYAHPCKQISHIQYAVSKHVLLMTFDSESELRKIRSHAPHAHLVLRIFVGTNKALCPLGLKFGAFLKDVPYLLSLASSLDLKVVGVSFHVGSGCFDESAYRVALGHSFHVFKIAESMNINLSLLDIGGGFPGNLESSENMMFFDRVCSTINSSLEEYFPASSGVRIIAEPGRYYVSSAFHLSVTVISSRQTGSSEDDFRQNYYVNDGVYGSFNCTIFDHYIGDHYLLSDVGGSLADSRLLPSTLWGPTCDSEDKIISNFLIREIAVGEKIVFKNMGAYTMAAASSFNGFTVPFVRYCCTFLDWESLCTHFNIELEDISNISRAILAGMHEDGEEFTRVSPELTCLGPA